MPFCGLFFFLVVLFSLAPLVRPGFSGRAEGETIIFFCGGRGSPPRAIARRRPPAAPGLRNPRGGALARVPRRGGAGGIRCSAGSAPAPPTPRAAAGARARCGDGRGVGPGPGSWAPASVAPGTLGNRERSLSIGRTSEHLLEWSVTGPAAVLADVSARFCVVAAPELTTCSLSWQRPWRPRGNGARWCHRGEHLRTDLRIYSLVDRGIGFIFFFYSLLQSNWNEIVDNFDDMNLKESLLRGIYAYGFEKPSAIQQRAIIPCIKGMQ